MMSPRYAPLMCVLVAIALVPTLIHSYSPVRAADGLTTGTIPATMAGYRGSPSGRSDTWGERRFASDDWIERNYTSRGDEVRLTIVRSDDLKALYHHPELAVAYGPTYGSTFDEYRVMRLNERREIPVHVLYPAEGGSAMAFYVLHYDGEFVENPIAFHILAAGEMLFSRRKPMTLFFAHDLRVPAGADLERLASVRLLFASIDSLLGETR